MNFRLRPYFRFIFGCLIVVGAYGAVGVMGKPQMACAAAGAGSQPPTPCDPQYMDALEARAWLEAQREIAQNQNLIVKPDSVLEYTCFHRFLNEIAEDASQMFSETTRWGNIPGLGSDSQDQALQRLMSVGLADYITNNFPHTYLGGRSDLDTDMEFMVQGGTYTCDQMGRVWNDAKCMNFFDETDLDGFFDFQWYTEFSRAPGSTPHSQGARTLADPRQLPVQFAACQPPADSTYSFQNMQAIAFNQRQTTYVLQEENPMDATQYNVDTLVTFLNFILPRGVGPATQCAQPIQTGITVNRRQVSAYQDAVCPNPGCYYTGTGGQCQ